jgi:hypothetical protein
LQILGIVMLAGAYEAVYSPVGRHIAFVRDRRRGPEIDTTVNDPANAESDAVALTARSQPDWQPVAPILPA